MLVPISQQTTPIILGEARQSATISSLMGSSLSLQEYAVAYHSTEISAGSGFMIVFDITDADIQDTVTSTEYGPKKVNISLKINGDEVRVISGQYAQPTGKIGALLNARIQVGDLALVPDDATVDFSVTIQTAAGTKTKKYMVDGKLVGRDYAQRMVGGELVQTTDELVISAIDKLNDRLELAPRRPVIMYNPSKVTINLPTGRDTGDYILDVAGNPILPILEPNSGLNMHAVLRRAYTTALGFNLISNIPNYTLKQANFSLEGSWHSGASQWVSFFDPIIFNDENTMYVIDADTYMPAGMAGPIITPDKHYALNDVKPFIPSKNAVLVTYEYKQGDWEDDEETGSIIETQVTDTVTDESGDFFDESYVKTTTTVIYNEITNSLDPNTVLATYELFRSVETVANIVDPVTSAISQKLVSKEETLIYYDGDLVIGYSKTVWGLLTAGSTTPDDIYIDLTTPDGAASSTYSVAAGPTLVPISTETNSVVWISDPLNPQNLIQAYNVTVLKGLIYKSGEAETVINPISGASQSIYRKWPILVAQSSGAIDTSGTRVWGPISTTREQLIRVRKNQSKVAVTITDHLNNTIKTSFTSGKVQERSAGSLDDQATKQKTILIRDYTSEGVIGARPPVSLPTTGMSRAEAMTLAYRVLARFQVNRAPMPVEMPSPDFRVRRGATLQLQNRDGDLTGVFITGFTIPFENLGTEGHRISMTLDTIKLLTR